MAKKQEEEQKKLEQMRAMEEQQKKKQEQQVRNRTTLQLNDERAVSENETERDIYVSRSLLIYFQRQNELQSKRKQQDDSKSRGASNVSSAPSNTPPSISGGFTYTPPVFAPAPASSTTGFAPTPTPRVPSSEAPPEQVFLLTWCRLIGHSTSQQRC
jgi:hypothetical protein